MKENWTIKNDMDVTFDKLQLSYPAFQEVMQSLSVGAVV